MACFVNLPSSLTCVVGIIEISADTVSIPFALRVFFFFSSRRRHTRSGDWSSDVCSSDLLAGDGLAGVWHAEAGKPDAGLFGDGVQDRSEERRVGKECRSRWSPYDSKK